MVSIKMKFGDYFCQLYGKQISMVFFLGILTFIHAKTPKKRHSTRKTKFIQCLPDNLVNLELK